MLNTCSHSRRLAVVSVQAPSTDSASPAAPQRSIRYTLTSINCVGWWIQTLMPSYTWHHTSDGTNALRILACIKCTVLNITHTLTNLLYRAVPYTQGSISHSIFCTALPGLAWSRGYRCEKALPRECKVRIFIRILYYRYSNIYSCNSMNTIINCIIRTKARWMWHVQKMMT